MLHSAGEAIVWAAGVIAALGVLWRYIVRPITRARREAWRRFHALADLVERELTYNGGASMKDATSATRRDFARTFRELGEISRRQVDLERTQRATASVLDNLATTKALEHHEIWKTLAEHGIDRRQPPELEEQT